MVINDKIDFDTAKILISEYKKLGVKAYKTWGNAEKLPAIFSIRTIPVNISHIILNKMKNQICKITFLYNGEIVLKTEN